MNMTPPGVPQQQFMPQQQQFFQPEMPMPEGGGGQEFPSEEFQSGGTDEAAYQPDEGMEGLGADDAPISPLATTITQYRDIALDTAKTLRDEFGRPRKEKKPKPEPANNTWLWLALGAGLGFLAYKQYKK
jgi:hypothetical protein